MAPLILKGTCRFWSNTCCYPDDVFFRDVAAYFTKTMQGLSLHKLQQCITVWVHTSLPAVPTCAPLKMCGATQTPDCRATEVVYHERISVSKLQHCVLSSQTPKVIWKKTWCGLLCSDLLGRRKHSEGQEKPQLAGQESLLCPGLPSGLCRGAGWEEDVSQAGINHAQHHSAPVWDCGGRKQLLQQLLHATAAGNLFQQSPDSLTQRSQKCNTTIRLHLSLSRSS